MPAIRTDAFSPGSSHVRSAVCVAVCRRGIGSGRGAPWRAPRRTGFLGVVSRGIGGECRTAQGANETRRWASLAADSTGGDNPQDAARAEQSRAEGEAKGRVIAMAWSLLRPDLSLLILTVSTLVVSVLVTLGFPLALGDLFDSIRSFLTASAAAGTKPDVLPLWGTGIGTYVNLVKMAKETAPPEFYPTLFRLCGCLVLSSMGNAASAYLASMLGERYGKRLRKQTMRRMMEKNQLFYDRHTRGELISRLNADCSAVQTTLTDFLGQRGVRSVIEILFSLVIISIKNPLSAFVSIVVTPAITLAMRGIVKRSAALTVERQEAAAASMSFATERIAHVRTVQLFGQEMREARAYQGYCDAEYAIAKQVAWFQGLVEGAGRFAVNMGALSLLAIGGVLVLSGRMQVGTLLAFQVYNFFLTIGLGSLSASLGDLGKVSGSLSRLEEILRVDDGYTTADGFEDTEKDGTETGDGAAASIRFEHVWFKYPESNDWVLKDVSFEAAPGDKVALVGQSGSGKSTIAALLLGLYEPQRGAIYVDGEKLVHDNIGRLRSKTGTMFQRPGIMSGTIEDQIRMGKPSATDEEIARAVELSHCKEFVSETSSSGLKYEVGERGSNLSGGQQQRVALARALVRRPQLLILDEPTAALDAASEKFIDMTLSELECTQVVIAHRLSTIRNADIILVVENGCIVERGRHAELVELPGGKYANMLSFA